MRRKILFLTVNFPPNNSVGTHRVAKILKYLDQQKFQISVLTLKEEYYDLSFGKNWDDAAKIPKTVKVVRSDKTDLTYPFTKAKALIKRYFSHSNKKSGHVAQKSKKTKNTEMLPSKKSNLENVIEGLRDFLFSIFEFPDKYIGWLPNAVRESVRLVKEEKIDAIYTTAPPHSLFLMALLVKKITKVKLILDYRDPWALSRWDKGNSLKSLLESWLEKNTIKTADLCLFVTHKLQEEYAKAYGQFDPNKFKVFSNGYDPDDFKNIPKISSAKIEKDSMRFVHLGTLYKKRDPSPLFQAVAELLNEGKLDPKTIQIDFIGIVAKELQEIHEKIKKMGLQQIIHFYPPVSFTDSIQTMYEADALLLIQPGTDLQIPAKLFEYMYTQKPIFAVAELNSATEQTLLQGHLGAFAPADNIAEIKTAIIRCLKLIGKKVKPNEAFIQSFDYSKYIKVLEKYLESI